MVIDVLQVPSVYSRLGHNPLCTLLYEDDSRTPDDWEDVGNSTYTNIGDSVCCVDTH